MRFSRVAGVLIITFSVSFSIFYVFWFFGLLPIDPELAVKIPVLIIVIGICFVASWIGYIMVTAPGPFTEEEENRHFTDFFFYSPVTTTR